MTQLAGEAVHSRPRDLWSRNQGASFIVVTHNGVATISDSLNSILRQPLHGHESEIIVVDNASTDGTLQLVRSKFPGVKLIANDRNLGYAAGNNLGSKVATHDVFCFVTQDVTLDDDWSRQLCQFLNENTACGAVEGQLYLRQFPTTLNCGGSYLNLLAFGCPAKYGEKDTDDGIPKRVSYASGAAFAVKRQAFFEVGGFDESYFMYHEDVDLGLRMARRGWTVFYVPRAKAFHAYDSSLRPWKMELLERNRWRTLLKDFPNGYLLRCAPLLLISELAIALQFLAIGMFGAKVRAMLAFLEGLSESWQLRRTISALDGSGKSVYEIVTGDVPATIPLSPGWTRIARSLQARYKKAFLIPQSHGTRRAQSHEG